MKIDISITVDGKTGGLLGVSLDDIKKPIITKKKRKKKRKDLLTKAVESTIDKKSEYETETV